MDGLDGDEFAIVTITRDHIAGARRSRTGRGGDGLFAEQQAVEDHELQHPQRCAERVLLAPAPSADALSWLHD